MGYVVERQGRWYAVGYEGLHPTTGADRRVGTERRTSWRRACSPRGYRICHALSARTG